MNKIISNKDANNSDEKKNDLNSLVDKKIIFFKDVIQKTIIHVQKNKTFNILGVGEVNNCIQILHAVDDKIKILSEKIKNIDENEAVNDLQSINNSLSSVLKMYGTDSMEDLLSICFGSMHSVITTSEEEYKYGLLKKYFHPTSYKILNQTESHDQKNKKKVSMEDTTHENIKNFDCFDINTTSKSFYAKVHGLKIYMYHPSQKIYLFVYGILDDVILKFISNSYITTLSQLISRHLPSEIVVNKSTLQVFNEFTQSLSLKDYLINEYQDIYKKFFGMLNQFKLLKQKNLNSMAKEFIQSDLYSKRTMLINLLVNTDTYENKYIAYLLYDLLSNDSNGAIDTVEQTTLFDSFPWSIKDSFREAMKNTAQYTNDLCNFDINKIPLEQQICIMKGPESVKEKAMMKLKEVKSKSDDSGSKARHYLDGLLKIPFEIYKKEAIMNVMSEIKQDFNGLMLAQSFMFENIVKKESYTGAEIRKIMNSIKKDIPFLFASSNLQKNGILSQLKRDELLTIVREINLCLSKEKEKEKTIKRIRTSNAKKEDLVEELTNLFQKIKSNPQLEKNVFEILFSNLKHNNASINLEVEENKFSSVTKNFDKISEYMSNVKSTLDCAIHGHENAKKQIERIIGQWINGEQDGYCFGFEGPPGVGKTSLAKCGLSNCLKDENGISRPFAMIQMGGETNGSTLHGHNYTYVGSTWGSIVQILIDKKCMNPIIFIDELDKISQTEHGREIVGILTHLLDPTQNDSFQDKYFSGIDLDLSKALFILSYNDVNLIDKILLDRIHRIKFSCLTLEEKLEIATNHMLPEIYKKMGMEGMITFSRDVLTILLEEYVSEPGVRKLKQLLFEIVGEINLEVLKNSNFEGEFPINVTIADIKTKYLKDKREIKIQKIHDANSIGVINGLWANSLGKGGIIPIQAKFFPSDKFLDLKLTGMQGDVMKESMNVALTLAWNLTSGKRREELGEMYNQENLSKYGIHIHCPDGAVPKDGPSAGTAITTVLYSLLNNKKIRNDYAITGEISLDGKVTEIGGLDLKIIGGIKAGIKNFIYPKENELDYKHFMDKYKDLEFVNGINFRSADRIEEVFNLIFE
jgi:endopeptidase La